MTGSDTVRAHVDGDATLIHGRLLVAPVGGTFAPAPPHEVTTEGEILRPGDVIGHVLGPGRSDDVSSFCTGFLVRLLAEPGERVRVGQPLAWVHPMATR